MGYSILYEALNEEIKEWEEKNIKEQIKIGQFSKKIQTEINNRIPQKIHDLFTNSIKITMNSVYYGDNFFDIISKKEDESKKSYYKKEKEARKKIEDYKKIAAVEGIGTGFGGFIGSIADFTLLLGIKYKLLLELSRIFQYDIKTKKERLFILYIFQLAFSDYHHKIKVYDYVKEYNITENKVEVAWQKLQQEYRDYIDIPKMLQMIPIIGAPIGGVVNYKLLDKLGETALHCYRVRFLQEWIID